MGTCAAVDFAWFVDRYEEHKVPAGTFMAFRVIETGVFSESGRIQESEYWYAPEVRRFIADDTDIVTTGFDLRLTEYTPALR